MSNFTDNMIEDGFDNPEDYMRYLENLSLEEYFNYQDLDIEIKDIHSDDDYDIEYISKEKSYEFFILPKDKEWNKLIIKNIGSSIIPKRFDKKYCKVDEYSLGFYTYNYYEYHEASLSFFRRDINITERDYFKKILLDDKKAFQEANEYYKNALFKYDSNNWKCSWDKLEISEINDKKCLMQSYSIFEGRVGTLYKRNCYTFFFENCQIEIYTRYAPIRGRMNKYDWKNRFETTINSFKFSDKLI
ncbi:hypothetical protein N9D22_02265 [Flavobacteriaceae bacterium]|nr:hypothetical protein [Flavobacteriaceae bacterium]